jgi:hypothetical protein
VTLLSYRDFAPPHQANGKVARLVVIAFFGSALLCGDIASAAWEIEPRIATGLRYSSNPRNVTDSSREESATGLQFDARLPMSVYSERSSLEVEPRVQIVRYAKDINEDLDLDNKGLKGNAQHTMRQSTVGLSGSYTELNTRTSEFETPDPDSPSGGSGLTFFDDTQKRWNVAPFWSYLISPKDRLGLNAGYTEVTFEEQTSVRRFDYDNNFLSASIQHSFNPKNSLSFRANLSEYNSGNLTGVSNESETNGLSLGYHRAVSETLDADVNLGWARSQSTVTFPNSLIELPGGGGFCAADLSPPPCEPIIGKSDTTNFVGGLTIAKSAEKTIYSAGINQTISPNSNGSEVLRLAFIANMSHKFSPRLSGSLGALAFQQKSVLQDAEVNRDYVSITSSLSWGLTEEWSIRGRYFYTYSRDKGLLADSWRSSQNHRLFIGVVYAPRGWRN